MQTALALAYADAVAFAVAVGRALARLGSEPCLSPIEGRVVGHGRASGAPPEDVAERIFRARLGAPPMPPMMVSAAAIAAATPHAMFGADHRGMIEGDRRHA